MEVGGTGGLGNVSLQNTVYFAKLHEPMVKHEKNLGCSACLFTELSIVTDRANNYSRGVRFSDSALTTSTSVSLTIIGPTSYTGKLAFSALTLLVGRQEGHRPVKN